MKKIIFILSFFFIYILSISASPHLKKGREAYDQKEYKKAIQIWTTDLSIEENRYNADIYNNIGNAYFRMGELGEAILFYEKAFRLEPQNKIIAHNLTFSHSLKKAYLEENKSIPEKFLDFICYRTLPIPFFIFLFFLFFFCFLITTGLSFFSKKRQLKKRSFYIAVISFVICLFLTFIFTKMKLQFTNSSEAIILKQQVLVKSSPNNESTTLATLYEGTKIKLKEQIGDTSWIAFELPNGVLGWIPKESIATIFPLYSKPLLIK